MHAKKIIPPKVTPPSQGQPTSTNCSTWLYSNLTTLSQGRTSPRTILAPPAHFIQMHQQKLYRSHITIHTILHFLETWWEPQHPKSLGHVSGPGNFQLCVTKTLTQSYSTIMTFIVSHGDCRASLVAQLVKNPPAMWETWV